MKIARMRSTPLSLPLEQEFVGIQRCNKINPVIVQLTTHEGLEAHGIAFVFNDYQVKSLKACIDDLAEVIIGQDIFNWAESWQKLWRNTSRMGHQGYGMNALSAIDSALWNLRAQALGVSLAKLLGGYRDEVPTYASHLLWRDWSIEQLQRDAVALVEQGFQAMKMRMGDKPFRAEIERLKAVREAVGPDVKIMIDVHGAWTVTESIQMGHEMEKYGLYWLEDPTPIHDLEGIAEIARILDVPVVIGENISSKYNFRHIIEKKAADIVMIDLQAVGGVTEWIKVANMAEAWNLPVVSHLFNEFSPHLLAAVPNGLIAEYMPWWDMIYKSPPEVKNGYIKIPDKPGLGYEIAPDVLEQYIIK